MPTSRPKVGHDDPSRSVPATRPQAAKRMEPADLEAWLEQLRGRLEDAGIGAKRRQNLLDMTEDWKPVIENGEMRFRSAALFAGKARQWDGHYRTLLFVLSTVSKQHAPPGQRFTLSKPRPADYILVEPTAAPTQTVVDPQCWHLQSRIKTLLPVRRVVFVQHSGKSVSPTISWLMDLGVDVDLYLQDPRVACCKPQEGKINMEISDVAGYYRAVQAGSLRIFRYSVPASVRGVVVEVDGPGGKPVAAMTSVGHYYYYRARKSPKGRTMTQIIGHVLPQTIAERGSPEFDPHYYHLMAPLLADLAAASTKPTIHRGLPRQFPG